MIVEPCNAKLLFRSECNESFTTTSFESIHGECATRHRTRSDCRTSADGSLIFLLSRTLLQRGHVNKLANLDMDRCISFVALSGFKSIPASARTSFIESGSIVVTLKSFGFRRSVVEKAMGVGSV